MLRILGGSPEGVEAGTLAARLREVCPHAFVPGLYGTNGKLTKLLRSSQSIQTIQSGSRLDYKTRCSNVAQAVWQPQPRYEACGIDGEDDELGHLRAHRLHPLEQHLARRVDLLLT